MSRLQPMGEELANCLVSLRPTHPGLAWSIFGFEWGAALIGIIVKVWTTGRFRYLSTSAYVIMGWAAVTAISPARSATSSASSGM